MFRRSGEEWNVIWQEANENILRKVPFCRDGQGLGLSHVQRELYWSRFLQSFGTADFESKLVCLGIYMPFFYAQKSGSKTLIGRADSPCNPVLGQQALHLIGL